MILLNDHEIKPMIFSDNTSQVWQIPEEVFKSRLSIHWEFEHEGEFLHIAQLCDLIAAKNMEVENLHIPYLPYARQDKEVSNYTTFAKKTFIRLLKNLPNVKNVSSVDVHSDVYGFVESKSVILNIYNTLVETKTDLICFPDKGAAQRYGNSAPCLLNNLPTCSFTKVRNQETGRIERLTLNELTDIQDRVILIVDDLADGCSTFIMVAERLYELGAKEVSLYTTHGIYSKGTDVVFNSGIKRIFNRKGEIFRDGK